MTTTEQETYLKLLDLQGFHQIIAISQDNINASLGGRFNDEIQPELLYFKKEIPGMGGMEATLDPPKVEICTESDAEATNSRFFVNFKTGSYKYKKTVEGGDVDTVDVSGWSIAFMVSYSEKKLKEAPSSNPAVKNKWESLEPGKYSLNQIVLFLGSAPLSSIDWKRSKTPGVDENKEPMKIIFFKMYMESYLLDLQNHADALTLGYNIKGEKVDDDAEKPTIPPTAVKYQNYRYIPSSDTASTINGKPVSNGARDAFLFLEMTGKEGFPRERLEQTGNFIIGDMPGNLAFSKSLFVDKYVVGSAFKDFNFSLVGTMNELLGFIQESWRKPTGWSLTEKGQEELRPELEWKVADDKASLDWTGKQRESVISFWTGIYGHECNSTLNSTIECLPRTNQIRVVSNIHITWESWNQPPGGKSEKKTRSSEAEIKLVLTFSMTVDQTGLLHTTVEEKLETCRCRDSDDKQNVKWLEWLLGPNNTDLADEMKKHLSGTIKLKHIGDALSERINSQQQFVFPGSGTFFYKNPVFSDRRDVLIRLEYQQQDL